MRQFRDVWLHTVIVLFSSVCLLVASGHDNTVNLEEQENMTAILVFSKTTGYRHESIVRGTEALQDLARQHDVQVDATEDAAVFTDQNLSRYKAIVFLNTSGTIFNDAQREAFERYIRGGGGFVGIHSATDTEYDWQWYDRMVGAHFKSHPAIAQATIRVEDRTHSSTSHLPEAWIRTDEWYDFLRNPRDQVHVLLSLDESTYEGGTMGADHPIAWYREFEGGRVWYTALGHTSESYSEPLFRQHLWGGIVYAAAL